MSTGSSEGEKKEKTGTYFKIAFYTCVELNVGEYPTIYQLYRQRNKVVSCMYSWFFYECALYFSQGGSKMTNTNVYELKMCIRKRTQISTYIVFQFGRLCSKRE